MCEAALKNAFQIENFSVRRGYLSGFRERAAVCDSSTRHVSAVSSVLNENCLGLLSFLSPVLHHRQRLPRVDSSCGSDKKKSSTVKKVLQPCWLSKYVRKGGILCLALLLYFLCKCVDFVCSKPTLTINIKDSVCVGVVSSVVSVCEGDASRQGMLGNTKQRGTELSLILQGQHPRERTSGVLTTLVYKHEKKKITYDKEVLVCVCVCVHVYMTL